MVWIAMAYILFVLVAGWVMTKKGSGVSDFFVAGRELSWFLMVPFLIAEFIGTMITVGNAEMGHSTGVAALLVFVGPLVTTPILAFVLVKFFRDLKKITIAEVFGVLFGQRMRLAYAIVILIVSTASMGGTFLGLGTILAPLVGIPYEWGVWLSAVIMVAMALVGLRGIAWMNLVHFTVIIVCFVIAALASVNSVGGVGNLIASLPAEHLNWWRPGWRTVSAWLLTPALGRLASTMLVMAIIASKDATTAKITVISTGLILPIFALLPMAMGLCAYVIMPDIPSKQALWKMSEYSGTAVSTLIALGVIAAIISTTPGILLSIAAVFCRDILLRIKPGTSERAQLALSKLFIPVFAFATTLFAFTQPSIFQLFVRVGQVTPMFAIVFITSVLWRRIHPTVALWSTLLSAGTGFSWFILNSPLGIDPLWPGLGIGILTLTILSLIRRPSPFRGVVGVVDEATTGTREGK